MRMHQLRKRILAARKNVSAEIAGNAGRGGLYARGFASEGYAGGFQKALDDVLALMNDVPPSNDIAGYWREEPRQ